MGRQQIISLESLGSAIAEMSTSLQMQLRALNHTPPSLEPNCPASMPQAPEVQRLRMQLLDSLANLLHLVTGPREFWLQQALFPNNEPLTIDVLNYFNFWDAVPLGGSASYTSIAQATNLPEEIVRRFLRMAFTMFVFAEEPGTGRVVHTAASAHIAREPLYKSFISHAVEDLRPAATVGVEALRRWSLGEPQPPQDIKTCAFALATDDGVQRGTDLWQFLDNFERPGKPKGYRAKRFAETMEVLGAMTADGTEAVLAKFDWQGLGQATVVDLGGSAGHFSALIANQHPQLRMIVQDLGTAEAAFNTHISSTGLASRIQFQSHNFFDRQDVPADVFFIKSVLHDWPDQQAIQIIRNLLPVLEPDNHVLVADVVMPPHCDEDGQPTLPIIVKKSLAAMDLNMHVAFNSKERNLGDWIDLMQRADARFTLQCHHIVPGSLFGLMDFRLGP